MLLSFKVKNYLSFKDEIGFSMEANKKIRTHSTSNNKDIITLKSGEIIRLNKTAIFYGANASGKTNIFKGLDFLKYLTLNSFGFQPGLGIKEELLEREKQGLRIFFDKFLLDEDSKEQDIEFEIEFLIDKVKYKYFLKLNENIILNEKLSFFDKSEDSKTIKEINIINRLKTKLTIEDSFFGFEDNDIEIYKIFPRDNQTFISILADKDRKGKFLATKILKFFRGINFIDSRADFKVFTLPFIENKTKKSIVLNFIKNADINIEDIRQEEKEYNKDKGPIILPNGQMIIPDKELELNFVHPVYQKEKRIGNIGFNLEKQESLGTKRLFGLVGIILSTIENNGILLIDEVDTHMHSLVIENLINLIHGLNDDGKNNVGEAQFIFNTHNLNLLDLELFKKDQIYFTAKDYYGATEIYSLDDFKDIQIRNNSDIKKAYKLGIFGAVPILSDFSL